MAQGHEDGLDGVVVEITLGQIQAREDAIISKAERDAEALCCTDGQFDGEELLEDWIELDAGNPLPPARLDLIGPEQAGGGVSDFVF